MKWLTRIHAIALAFFVTPSFAGWSVETHKDSMTDKIISTAVCTNSGGYSLKVYRVDGGAVMLTFRLPDNSFDVLDARLPIFRIDKNEPEDSEELSKLVPENFQREPKWASWVIFHGEGAPNRGTLRDLMDGTRMVLRYFLFTGGFKETSFSLVGAKRTIASAIGVPEDANSQAAAKQATYFKAAAETSDKCMSTAKTPAEAIACSHKSTKCSEIAGGDAEKLRNCMK